MSDKTNWISCVVDDELLLLINREHARRLRKPDKGRISKSDVIRDALIAYLKPGSQVVK